MLQYKILDVKDLLKYLTSHFVEAVLSVWDLTFGTLQYRQNILASSHLNLEDEDNFCSDHTLQVSYE